MFRTDVPGVSLYRRAKGDLVELGVCREVVREGHQPGSGEIRGLTDRELPRGGFVLHFRSIGSGIRYQVVEDFIQAIVPH